MNVAIAQINTTVGDLGGNAEKIRQAYAQGLREGAALVLTPELSLTGYPPRDLLLREDFVTANLDALADLARSTTEATGLIVGFVDRSARRPGRSLANAAALLHRGKVQAIRTKTLLPTYDVFDEDRYFEPAEQNAPIAFAGRSIGLTICEDLWNDDDFWQDRRYRRNPGTELVQAGADLLLNLSASPWQCGKNRVRRRMLESLVAKTRVPLVYCNLTGGNDELIFDGDSLVLDGKGGLIRRGRQFDEDFFLADVDASGGCVGEEADEIEQVYRALVLGLRDYLHKCGFRTAVLGLSGGIDSALVASLATAALGAENVRGVSLPSQFSSEGSLRDARELAANLGIQYDVVPIQPAFEALKRQLQPMFAGRPEDTTEENIQARLRGVILMALSNKFGSMVLTTGNKSEMAVGYCTLYGDMCGGLAVIADVPKMMVYRLARWINRDRIVIPESSLTKAPSAELRPNQTDQDSLPPYDELDAILEAYVVEGKCREEIIATGHSPATVQRVVRLIDQSEYKRRQAAPGLRVTSKAFGIGRRVPIAQRYRR